MKIVVFGPQRRTGALRDGMVVDLCGAYAKYIFEKKGEAHPMQLAEALVPSDLARFIEGGSRTLEETEAALDYLFGHALNQHDRRGMVLVNPAEEVRLHPPKPARGRIACAGGNFADHAAAMAEKMSGKPFTGDARAHIRNAGIWGFWKVLREVAGPDGTVIYPKKATRLDYEGELAIVLGKRGTDIRAQDARDYVWGVTLLGDWSIRAPREPAGHHNFAMGKNFDTSCSLGPCIAVGECDPFAADVETWVNGERRQSFNTRDMVFSFGEYLEYLSADLTLHPGDIISGGTAAGTAADSSPLLADGTSAPERYLKPGDTVEIRSPAIGTLRTRIVAPFR
ncbi:MAG TPA: fumarylacetoacetate hydrolase family protein [Stellaceae bacterium]|jgi:2-keto-4-pentenoate hydratase/2-oxohepta-3-ene-1,7-dioic acid hydratase in catechol pathway|nr:fumarylacetoacetate hydrolase family protein [Stellaceae bacterium]